MGPVTEQRRPSGLVVRGRSIGPFAANAALPSQAPADSATGVADGGSRHAVAGGTSDPARAASFAHGNDHLVRLLERYRRPGLCGRRQGECKGNGYQSDHGLLPSLMIRTAQMPVTLRTWARGVRLSVPTLFAPPSPPRTHRDSRGRSLVRRARYLRRLRRAGLRATRASTIAVLRSHHR